LGEAVQVTVFAVGGLVRDLLLGVPNLDLDVVVEGDGIAFARQLARFWGGTVTVHPPFGTAVIILPGGQHVDVATARTEVYERPAALPQTRPASLREDLFRRDFTINALAVQLNPSQFGQLVDFFGGWEDLASGTVRVLHPLSFRDDPTRILRAVRFEQRYGFHLSPDTEQRLREALSNDWLNLLTGERLRDELSLLLQEANPLPALRRLTEMQVWPRIHPALTGSETALAQVERMRETVAWFREHRPDEAIVEWAGYLACLVQPKPAAGSSLSDRLRLNQKEAHIVRAVTERGADLLAALELETRRPAEVYELLEREPIELALWLRASASAGQVRKKVERFLLHDRYLRTEISGKDLIALGYRPGPAFGEALRAALRARLNGEAKTRAEELAVARQVLEGGK